MPTVEPVLLDVRRNGFCESRHRGRLVLLDGSGQVTVAAGDVEAPILPRSSLKPFQAAAMCASGFPGDEAALALAAASHEGEPVHVDGARAVLRSAGLTEVALGCPPALPAEADALGRWLGSGLGPASICHNCSGKHAAMVATCMANGWDVASYLDPAHPLQVAVRASIERASGERVAVVTVDGCGAPAFGISLLGLARAFAALATAPAESPLGRVATAMRAHPHLIGGTRRAVTELTAGVPGLVCKDGAEGVWGAALPDGRAFAVKIADGGARGLGPVLAAALRHWGHNRPAVQRWSEVAVLGGGVPVGGITWSPELRALLAV